MTANAASNDQKPREGLLSFPPGENPHDAGLYIYKKKKKSVDVTTVQYDVQTQTSVQCS